MAEGDGMSAPKKRALVPRCVIRVRDGKIIHRHNFRPYDHPWGEDVEVQYCAHCKRQRLRRLRDGIFEGTNTWTRWAYEKKETA